MLDFGCGRKPNEQKKSVCEKNVNIKFFIHFYSFLVKFGVFSVQEYIGRSVGCALVSVPVCSIFFYGGARFAVKITLRRVVRVKLTASREDYFRGCTV